MDTKAKMAAEAAGMGMKSFNVYIRESMQHFQDHETFENKQGLHRRCYNSTPKYFITSRSKAAKSSYFELQIPPSGQRPCARDHQFQGPVPFDQRKLIDKYHYFAIKSQQRIEFYNSSKVKL